MKIKNVIFQDLESSGKEKGFRNGYGKTFDYCLQNSKSILK